jgi:hypothetical protein
LSVDAGPNISLNGSGTIGWRHEDEYSNGYVFTADPLVSGERIVVQILATENMYIGSLAFGLTSCDPAGLDPDRLPEDSDMLLDRSEYWVVSKVNIFLYNYSVPAFHQEILFYHFHTSTIHIGRQALKKFTWYWYLYSFLKQLGNMARIFVVKNR